MRIAGIILLFIVAFNVKAQDVHFTQKFNIPTYESPALTGNGTKVNRLSVLYRDQWRVVPVKYVSAFINYDRKIFENEEHLFAAGLQFLYDRAGDGALSTFNPNISVAYTRFFNGKKQGLSLGLNVGFLQRTIDASKLQFDSQYDGVQYDPNIVSGESFEPNAKGPNMGIGINFMTKMGKQSKWDIGFVVVNPHQPNFNFYDGTVGNNESKEGRPIRYKTYVTAELFVHPQWSITPSVYFQHQHKAQELHTSAFVSYYTKSDKTPIKLSLGGGYRLDDAALAYTAVKVKDVQLGFSYDVNTSAFTDATNRKGGFEISLVYEWEKKKDELIDTPEIIMDTIFITQVDSNEVEEQEDEIIETPKPETPEVVEVEQPKPIIPVEVDLIQKDLPIKLFFDNDHPNPNSLATTTNLSYTKTLHEYQLKQYEFSKQIGKEAADEWFRRVYQSSIELDTLVQYATTLLEQGYQIELTIKGYASPLATSDYNVNLSKRRIASVILELKNKNFGSLVPYFRDGSIKVVESPYGESTAPATVNDNSSNKKQSIYSVEASYERRVEIIAVKAVK